MAAPCPALANRPPYVQRPRNLGHLMLRAPTPRRPLPSHPPLRWPNLTDLVEAPLYRRWLGVSWLAALDASAIDAPDRVVPLSSARAVAAREDGGFRGLCMARGGALVLPPVEASLLRCGLAVARARRIVPRERGERGTRARVEGLLRSAVSHARHHVSARTMRPGRLDRLSEPLGAGDSTFGAPSGDGGFHHAASMAARRADHERPRHRGPSFDVEGLRDR